MKKCQPEKNFWRVNFSDNILGLILNILDAHKTQNTFKILLIPAISEKHGTKFTNFYDFSVKKVTVEKTKQNNLVFLLKRSLKVNEKSEWKS